MVEKLFRMKEEADFDKKNEKEPVKEPKDNKSVEE